jgi:hypothetical protein
LLFCCYYQNKAQIANYVKNGGFDSLINLNSPNNEYKAFGWSGLDSLKFSAPIYNSQYGGIVPNIPGIGYQWPKDGTGFIRVTTYCPNCPAGFKRGNIKNRLKQTLTAGKTYCAKAYVSVQDICSKGIDAYGFYFGDNTVDTIKYNGLLPLTFLNPQVQNPTGNIITDTMNWTPITGTFVANGTEKFMVLANFKSDVMTNTATANSSVAGNYSEWFVDAVSCMPTDLPAYAGADIYGIPTTTVYLGRQQDVGIDEACMWYKLPNTTTAIDTAAGITVTVAATTQTYMVKQDICGVIKYDTVVVHTGVVGLQQQELIKNNFNLFPNPATSELNLSYTIDELADYKKISIYNNLGQVIREEELVFKDKHTIIKISDLQNGVYVLNLKSTNSQTVSKRFVAAR